MKITITLIFILSLNLSCRYTKHSSTSNTSNIEIAPDDMDVDNDNRVNQWVDVDYSEIESDTIPFLNLSFRQIDPPPDGPGGLA